MDKTVYATDGNYFLVPLSEAEKENYLQLSRENSAGRVLKDLQYEEVLWKDSFSETKRNYSIYDQYETYCGNIEFYRLDTPTPEIGIDLLKEHRNKGIAGRVIKLLARKISSELKSLEYYLLRVSVGNTHSRHMIEKLGAIYIGEEESFVVKAMKQLKNGIEKEKYETAYDKCSKILEELLADETNKVLVYKLTSDHYANE